MLFFGLSLVAGVAAVWAVQKMDIEYVNANRPKQAVFRRKADKRQAAPADFVPGAVFLRQQ